jgi:hypothetical protein
MPYNTSTHKQLMTKTKLTPSPYTLVPGTQVLRSKIDVFELHDEYENKTHRVELSVDNDGVFITSCEKAVREDISISHKDVAIVLARAILEAYGEL